MAIVTRPMPTRAVDYFREKLTFETTPHTLKENMEHGSVCVVDVREPEAFRKEHIPEAINCPLPELTAHLAELPKDKTIVAYCWDLVCDLSTRAALQLSEKGFHAQMLRGGIAEWRKGFAVGKSAPAGRRRARHGR